jgi:hypothetical protein
MMQLNGKLLTVAMACHGMCPHDHASFQVFMDQRGTETWLNLIYAVTVTFLVGNDLKKSGSSS